MARDTPTMGYVMAVCAQLQAVARGGRPDPMDADAYAEWSRLVYIALDALEETDD